MNMVKNPRFISGCATKINKTYKFISKLQFVKRIAGQSKSRPLLERLIVWRLYAALVISSYSD